MLLHLLVREAARASRRQTCERTASQKTGAVATESRRRLLFGPSRLGSRRSQRFWEQSAILKRRGAFADGSPGTFCPDSRYTSALSRASVEYLLHQEIR